MLSSPSPTLICPYILPPNQPGLSTADEIFSEPCLGSSSTAISAQHSSLVLT